MSTTPTDTPSRPLGRPTVFTADVIEAILEGLAEGRSIVRICEREDMPSARAVYCRQRTDPAFESACDAARKAGVNALVDEADDLTRTAVETPPSREKMAAIRERLDFVKWSAECHKPKVYNRNRRVELSGPDGAPIRLQAVAAPSPPLPPREVREYVQNLLKTAEQAAGLPPGDDRPDADRITAVLKSGRLPHPDLVDAFANVDPSDTESAQ
jgi:hypothetical protein